MSFLLYLFAIAGLIIISTSNASDNSQENNNYPTPTETHVLDSKTEETLGPLIPNYSPPTFNGYPCTQDCSGHEAGYAWAEEHGIEDIDDCGGNSNSFIEGCESYVEENYSSYDDYEEDYYEDNSYDFYP